MPLNLAVDLLYPLLPTWLRLCANPERPTRPEAPLQHQRHAFLPLGDAQAMGRVFARHWERVVYVLYGWKIPREEDAMDRLWVRARFGVLSIALVCL